ncbi:sialate O-acetylesterase [Aliiglaciecola sp. LCG003]|uniref:sialate O-acetylesterase n=1 Tax=Aliiglaciecola sp. LCG003 TaxID=3053655 RepID=UPI002573C742|nr:sialate O-acetylesterase [Aliiglaciecola sp. LCG003]WJG09545.1 sialate O-acetylesterase [Aliiglaciecola sp. LCG003]
MYKVLLFVLLSALLQLTVLERAYADISLSPYYSNNLLIQRNRPFSLSGNAASGEAVTVRIAQLERHTVADSKGHWSVTFPAQAAASNQSIHFKGENLITLTGVAFGDLWLASGQSNMELPIRRVLEKYPDILKAQSFANVRQFKVQRAYDFNQELNQYPQGQWSIASANTLADFSAVAWFFAQDLYHKTKVPIGIINASVGGSPIEAWMSSRILQDYPDILQYANQFKDDAFIEQIQNTDKKRLDKWFAELNLNDPGLNETPTWYADNLDINGWQSIQLPRLVADGNSSSFNGSMWFRKTITLGPQELNEDAKLRLGAMVDADTTFINGVQVGTTGYQYPPRIYTVPAGLLKAGENTITIRLTSHLNKIGLVPDKPYYLQTSQKRHELNGQWRFRVGFQSTADKGWDFIHYKPTGLFNAMIAPATNHSIAGVIWYQGESNTGEPNGYADKLVSMIKDWRARWEQTDLPFLIVQLANFMPPSDVPVESNWAELRYEQYQASKRLNRVGLALTYDVGEWNDIHPLDKQTVGQRLALLAQKYAYAQDITYSGPELSHVKQNATQIELIFKHTAGGLHSSSVLKGFSVALHDRKFVWADAKIIGNKVLLSNPLDSDAVYVRYAWEDNPIAANLYNGAGLPAIPFERKLSQ